MNLKQDRFEFLKVAIFQVYGDFVMTTHVRFMHVNDLDQAGLMVRLNNSCWLKAGVTNHPPGLSTFRLSLDPCLWTVLG